MVERGGRAVAVAPRCGPVTGAMASSDEARRPRSSARNRTRQRTWVSSQRSVWEPELRGHAIANGFWVAGVNRVGTELESTYYGASVFIDPIGQVVAQAGAGEEVLVADLPRSRVEEVRRAWPFYRDRRPDAYGALVRP